MMTNSTCLFNMPHRNHGCHKVAYPITERDSILEKAIAKEFECPVCLNFSCPPIMMCKNSHIICFDCWKRCSNCPTCRTSKTITRAFALEKVHPLINFPCRWDGCLFTASGSYTGTHEHICKYFPINCPLADTHRCNWTGTMETVKQHLKEYHEDNVCFQQNVYLMSKWFANSLKKDYTIIFIVDDRLFKFYWFFDLTISPIVRFGMVSIGNGNPIVNYNYTLVFTRQVPNSRKIKWLRSLVQKSLTDCSIVNRDLSLRATRIFNHEQNYTELANFCIGNDLKYQVTIELNQVNKYNKLNLNF